MRLLSKITGDPTVRFLRSKKESRSTWRGQREGIGFKAFRQTLCEVGVLSYLFYS